jgi:hypothetical protein
MAGIDTYTKLMLHCDGGDASTTFTDSSSSAKATESVNGASQIDTAQSVFGGASGLFDGSGDYIRYADSADWDLTGDFTIDFRFRVTATGRSHTFCARPDMLGSQSVELMVRMLSDNTFDCFIRTGTGGGSIIGRITVASGVSTNTWYHLAYVRNGTGFALYRDGTCIGTATSASVGGSTAYKFDVGGRGDASAESVSGWIDEFRVSNGIARWTSNFTPPAEAYSLDGMAGAMTMNAGWW